MAASLAALALLASTLQASVPAPPDSASGIRGKASSAINGQSLAGVTIAAIERKRQAGSDSTAVEVKKSVVTDSTGVFWLGGLAAGKQAIRVSYNGRSVDDAFTLDPNTTTRIAILLDSALEDLGATIVEVRQPQVWRDLAGFYERRDLYTGFARFFTREDINRIKPKRISSLLTLEGISTRCSRTFCTPTRLNNGVMCAVPVNVDGMPFQETSYDDIRMAQVAAVEVYRGVPPVGLSEPLPGAPGPSIWVGGTSGRGSAGSCGLVMIWTR
jgi:hypothetical protein